MAPLSARALQSAIGVLGLGEGAEGALQELLERTVAPIPRLEDVEAALRWLVGITQACWLRAPGSERWQQSELPMYLEQRAEFFRCFAELRLLDRVLPTSRRFDHVLVLSSVEAVFKKRLSFLAELLDRQVDVGAIHLVGGERRLVPELEPEGAAVLGSEATEMEMLVHQFRAYQSQGLLPGELNFSVSSTPYQRTRDGGLRRPNTLDTIESWLRDGPVPGDVLCLSSQPFVPYQAAIVQAVLPEAYRVEASGAEIVKDERVSVILDSLARWIYVRATTMLCARN